MAPVREWFLCLALIPFVGGCCASFRAGRVERIRAWPPGPPPEAEKLRSISLAFEGKGIEGSREAPLDPRSQFLYANATALAYYRSDRFTHVWPGIEPADVKAGVRLSVVRTRAPLGLRVAHVLTLGLVPCWERHDFTAVTAYTDQARKPLGRFEKSERVTTWSHALLFVVYPFAPPPGVTAGCVFDLSRATIIAALGQGVF